MPFESVLPRRAEARRRTLKGFGVGLGLTLLAVLTASPAAALIDVVGERRATFDWRPATGPVIGYLVFVSTNGGGFAYEKLVVDRTEVTVERQFGDSILVEVAAFSIDLMVGARSSSSEEIRFIAPQGPPPIDPPDGDPPGHDDPQTTGTRVDFDGDGQSDILLRHGPTDWLRLWAGDGSGYVEDLFQVPPGFEFVAKGDYDADGIADMLWYDTATGRVTVYLPQSDYALLQPRLGWKVVGTGDYDADRCTDIVIRDEESGAIELWLMHEAQVHEVLPLPHEIGPGWSLAGTADLNGDGNADLLWQHEVGVVFVWFMQRGQIVDLAALDTAQLNQRLVSTADVDGDGRQDLVWRDDKGETAAWLMGSRSVRSIADYGSPGLDWRLVGTHDLDDDGRDDVVWRHEDGALESWLLDGERVDGELGLGDPGPAWDAVGMPGETGSLTVVSDFSNFAGDFWSVIPYDQDADTVDLQGSSQWRSATTRTLYPIELLEDAKVTLTAGAGTSGASLGVTFVNASGSNVGSLTLLSVPTPGVHQVEGGSITAPPGASDFRFWIGVVNGDARMDHLSVLRP